jgi:hypothetical protein
MGDRAPIRDSAGDEGYMLLAVVVLVFVVLLMLSIAAPQMATALKHDQEIETKHRADQYVRAIRMYYRKTHSYPPSMEVLSQKTNGQRYLRQKYLDPLTGKDDWRMIIVGQNKTKLKGLFGQDLPGLTGGGLGSAAGMQSTTGGNTGSAFNNSGSSNGGSNGGSSFGSSSGGSFGGSSGASGSSFGSGNSGIGSTPQPGTGSTTAGGAFGSTNGSNPTNGSGSTSGLGTGSSTGTGSGDTSSIGTAGPIMGVGVPKDGASLLTVNEQTNYKDWEFLYDPRTETNGAAGIGGGGTGTGTGLQTGAGTSGGTSLFGSGSGTANPGDTTTTPPTTTNPTAPMQPGNPTPQ